MKLLISNRMYFPVMGGTPVLTRVLANEFIRMGHEVKVVVRTAADATTEDAAEAFPVIRFPSISELWDLSEWADLNLQIEGSLKFAWPFYLRGKPVVISHQTHCFGRVAGLQREFTRLSHPISISQMIYAEWGARGIIVPNPYDDQIFYRGEADRSVDLLFVGRLIEDKGVVDLIDALALLKQRGLTPRAHFIGDYKDQQGLASERYQKQVDALGLGSTVRFLGSQSQHLVAEAMRKARILVAPSRWEEPFGIVGLEGLASGCLVVGSRRGGLVEAVGEHGIWFENGDATDLARALEEALHTKWSEAKQHEVADYIAGFTSQNIARRYVKLFEAVLP